VVILAHDRHRFLRLNGAIINGKAIDSDPIATSNVSTPMI